MKLVEKIIIVLGLLVEVIVIGLIFCFFTSCKTQKTTEKKQFLQDTQYSDSTVIYEKELVATVIVPESKASIMLQSSEIDALPKGAAYTSKSGRASVSITNTGNNSYEVSANCDSLFFLIEQKTSEIYRLQKRNSELLDRQESKGIEIIREPTPFQWFQIYGFYVLIAIIIVVFIFKKFDLWQKILKLPKMIFK